MSKCLYRDILILVKKDTGERIENIYAAVSKNTITTYSADFDIDPGDVFLRTRPTGSQEQYRVLSPGFVQQFGGFQPHYSAQVEFVGSLKKESMPRIEKVVISGDNARLNINSQDNSSNIVANAQPDTRLFENLANAAGGIQEESARENVVSAIRDMSQMANDKGAFVKSYNAFIASAANHMTLFTPFIPALTQILSGL